MAPRPTSQAPGSRSGPKPGKSGISPSAATAPTATASPNSTVSSAPPSSTPASPPGPRYFIPWIAILAGLIVVAGAGLTALAYTTQTRTIVRSVTIGAQDVGSLTTLEALSESEQVWNQFAGTGLQFTLAGKTYAVPLSDVSASEEEVVLEIANFDAEASVNAAFDYGHRGPWWQQARERLSGYLGRRHEFGRFAFAQKSVEEVLKKKLAGFSKAPQDAGLKVEGKTWTVTPSTPGQSVDVASGLRSTRRQVMTFDSTPIALTIVTIPPEIVSADGLPALADAEVPAVVQRAPITLTLEDKSWTINAEKLRTLLGFVQRGGATHVGFDRAKTLAYLETLRPNIDIAPRDAKFSITDGRVEEFQTSVVGRGIDAGETLQRLQASLADSADPAGQVSIAVIETKPLTDTVPTNNLGITELVSEARTNFRGSPPNRIYNLSFGAKKLHGLLIQPGETFSLVHALGPIDAKNGWKPELVIKGVKITPEFGGGLCQVATTMFRTVLNAGLPILERQNHSLRISYYEPPIGLDATIYEPKPDLKFKNDYQQPLLLQTRVEGTQLIFSFYGTKDARVVEIPEPKVFNKTGVPATKNIEVDDLKPGEKVCQAPGHPGADAIATYIVTKADGTKVTQEFKSHYRPLPVICRVGKKKT